MNSGRTLALTITVVTVVLIVLGTVFPSSFAAGLAGGGGKLMKSSSTPQAAVENLVDKIRRRDWNAAYNSLANKNEFTQTDFLRDVAGSYSSLRSYASLDGFDVHPLRSSADSAQVRVSLRWSSVVGTFQDVRELPITRVGDRWQVSWPIVREPRVPPQVIPVNYLRWDVIYRGAEDDWGAQDVEAPHVRIIDMHPVDRGGGVILLGELLNEDVVPAYVTVKASLLAKSGSELGTEDAFDKMSHILLPKQVTPFRIDFPNVRMAQVDSVRMDPTSTLVAASADPVVGIEDQKLGGLPTPSLSGKLVNQSGQIVNIAHVLGTFYDSTGNLVWVSDGYANRALLPGTPVPFSIAVPADISGRVSSYRVISSTYSSNRL